MADDKSNFRVVSRIEDFKHKQEGASARPPDVDIIRELEQLLIEARTGRLRSIAYVSVHGTPGGETSNLRCIGQDYMLIMQGLVTVLGQRIALQILAEMEQQQT